MTEFLNEHFSSKNGLKKVRKPTKKGKEKQEKEREKEIKAKKVKKYLQEKDFYNIFIKEILMSEMMKYVELVANYGEGSSESLQKLSGCIMATKGILNKIYKTANFTASEKESYNDLFNMSRLNNKMVEYGETLINKNNNKNK